MMYNYIVILVFVVLAGLVLDCTSTSVSVDCVLGKGKGCGRTPVTKPQGEEVIDVVTTEVPPEDTEHHRQNCTSDEVIQQGCLQGGTCFVVIIEQNRETNCQCPSTHIGKRCELFDFNPGGQEEGKDRSIATAGVAALTVAGVLFATIIILIVIWRKRYLKKKRTENDKDREKLKGPMNSNGSQSVRGEGWPTRHSHIPAEAIPLTTIVNENNSS
ncbi:uncharacterized protein [Argopecten irradians]|uniref:uncharacterized protein isoform X3 n=1 Tax=Argopecten irradians TaxID=31199 RepID=UPI003723C5AF